MKIVIETVTNGIIVEIEDGHIKPKEYVFRSIDILPMLEFVGEKINDKKVKVEER